MAKHPVAKHPVVTVHSPAPKFQPHPYVPKVNLAPTGGLAVKGAKSSSRAFSTLMWLLLEIGGAIALIVLLQWWRLIPALSPARIHFLRREPKVPERVAVAPPRPRPKVEAETAAAVAVAEPPAKVAAPKPAETPVKVAAHPATVAAESAKVVEPPAKVAEPPAKVVAAPTKPAPVSAEVAEPLSKVVAQLTEIAEPPAKLAEPPSQAPQPRREAGADPDETASITPPVRHVVTRSKARRLHRKAEALTEDAVPAAAPASAPAKRPSRRAPALPKVHLTHREEKADPDAEEGLYARSYLDWLEKH